MGVRASWLAHSLSKLWPWSRRAWLQDVPSSWPVAHLRLWSSLDDHASWRYWLWRVSVAFTCEEDDAEDIPVVGTASPVGRLAGAVEGTIGRASAASRRGRAAAAVVSTSLPRLLVIDSGTTGPDERVLFIEAAAAVFFLGGILLS